MPIASRFDAKTKPIVLGRAACSKSVRAADAAEFACLDEAFLFEIIDGVWRDTLRLRQDAEVDWREVSVGYLIFSFTQGADLLCTAIQGLNQWTIGVKRGTDKLTFTLGMHRTQDSRDFTADIATWRHVPGSEFQINRQRIHGSCNIFNAEIPVKRSRRRKCVSR